MSHKIVVDSRESRCGVPDWLTRLGLSYTTEEMPYGDYRLGDSFLVERKAADDFVASILDGRLFGQAEMLASQGCRAMLVVEGDLRTIWSKIDPEALAGALSALVVFFDLPVVTVATPEHVARLLGRMARHLGEGLGYEIPLRKKPKFDGAQAQFVIEGMPGVGPEMARKLLTHFGSPRAVLLASSAELLQVKGVGAKTVSAIEMALDFVPSSFRSTKNAGS